MNSKRRLSKIFIHAALCLVSIVCLFPIVWMCIIAFKDPSESVSGFSSLLIHQFSSQNISRLMALIPFGTNFKNSILSTLGGTITTLFFCSLAGFGFAKYRFPGRNGLFYFLIATMLVPPEVGSVPLFLIMKKLGLINSLWSLIIPRMTTAVGIFYMRQYILGVPDSLVEAARIDGCNEFKIYYRIVLPIIKPAIASWTVLTVVARWNDFFWPLLFLRNQENYTLMVSLSMLPFSEGMSTPWPVIMCGTMIITLPVIIVYLTMQLFFKEGITEGAVKG
ncbi:MAG: carbohydrate ABC transporter permease [Eubacteriales bacterium]|nr:carbohydrate ABC transporter permease [Eubacteriales bacterium]